MAESAFYAVILGALLIGYGWIEATRHRERDAASREMSDLRRRLRDHAEFRLLVMQGHPPADALDAVWPNRLADGGRAKRGHNVLAFQPPGRTRGDICA